MPDSRLTAIGQLVAPSALNDLLYIVDNPTGTAVSRSIAINDFNKFLQPFFNVQDYGAVEDSYYTDGVATISTGTFTSATANFTSADVGKTIVILRAGSSTAQDHHTTIATVVNTGTVTLSNNPGRSQSQARFYISRSDGQSTAIQSAIDAAYLAGGGTVVLPGVGYLIDAQLNLKNRVGLSGSGLRSTMLHAIAGLNNNVIINDQTTDNPSMFNFVENIWIDGNRARQSDTTTNLTVNYVTGATTLTVASATNLTNAGSLLIGTNRLTYTAKSGNVLSGVSGAQEGTFDANANSGTTVTQHKSGGIYFAPVPYNTASLYGESFDPHFLIRNVLVKNTKGDGIAIWGQSEARIENCWVNYADHFGFRASFDTWLSNCTADTNGRAGYFLKSSSCTVVNCKSFYSGGNVGSEGYGFFIEGPATLIEEGEKIFFSCCAQDNKADGFYVRNAQRIQIYGSASSNGTSATGTYAGLKIDGSTNGIFDIVSTDRVASPGATQYNGLILKETANIKNSALQIRMTHGNVTGGSNLTPVIQTGSVFTGGGVNITINGMGGMYSQTYTGTINPDPYLSTIYMIGTLTGSLTINNPVNAHFGCKLRFIAVQDSVGSRNITFGNNYTTTYGNAGNNKANKRLSIGFVYDGSTWQQTDISLVATGTASNWV